MIRQFIFMCFCMITVILPLHGSEYEWETIVSNSSRPENRSRSTKDLTKRIADAFRAANVLQEEEMFSAETFSALTQNAKQSGRPFFLAVLQAGPNVYHFFDAAGLARYFQTSRKFENPLNRQPVQQIFIYKYNGKRSQFPFEYVATTGDRSNFIAGTYQHSQESEIKQKYEREHKSKREHSYILSDTRRHHYPSEYSYISSNTGRPHPSLRSWL